MMKGHKQKRDEIVYDSLGEISREAGIYGVFVGKFIGFHVCKCSFVAVKSVDAT